jgi:hypothetical protein
VAAACPDTIHLLLTDVVLPRMTGREVAEHLAAVRPGLRVIFMSGYTADVITTRGVLPPGVKLVEKPFTLITLAQRVREVLDGPGPGA